MAMHKPAFKDLAAALADEIESVARQPHHQADSGVQQVQSITTSHAKNNPFEPILEEIFPEASQVSVEDWLEAQLLDCQNLAGRHGFTKLSGVLDEALDALVDERQGPGGSPADWQPQSQQ